MEDLKNKIKELSSNYHSEIIDIRRHIHANPELSEKEIKTADFIAAKLDEYGIAYEKGIADTGVVGLIKGKNPNSKTIALRADMDALPIIEENSCEYKSNYIGDARLWA